MRLLIFPAILFSLSSFIVADRRNKRVSRSEKLQF
jgi:hypothetical protein